MAIIKHISIKNSNYDAATDYLTLQHDEFTNRRILDESGNPTHREDYLIEGINCNPFTFGRECEATNALYHKNQGKSEIKAHHYIISFDPRDKTENGLTLEQAQSLCLSFAKQNFPGHQAIVCAHPDGHGVAGNIHVHIVINSVRKLDVARADFMERPGDALAGHKHHVTKNFLNHLKQETMTMCQEHSLYQVDLLSPAKVKITEREYWAARRGQAAAQSSGDQGKVYQTDKAFLRSAITAALQDTRTFDHFCAKLLEDYGITVNEANGSLSYTLPGKERPIRAKQLGTNFEKDHILTVIAETEQIRSWESPGKYIPSVQLVTDLETCAKAASSVAYARKVKIGNLRKMADTYAFLQSNGLHSVESLNQLLGATSADVSEKRKVLKATEAKLSATNLLIKHTGQYLAHKDTYRKYLHAGNKKKFREQHHTELALYEAARNHLKENAPAQSTGADGKIHFKTPSIKELRLEKERLTTLKNQQYEDYSYARARYRELQNVQKNLQSILGEGKEGRREQVLS